MTKVTRSILVCTFILIAAYAGAQQTTGNIIGRVVDIQGAAIAGATVSARNLDTGFIRDTTSDANGVFRLLTLPIGTYIVTAERAGLASFERPDVVVNVSRTTEIDIALRPAGVAETVVVSARAPLISTTSSSVGQVVEAERIESLPLNGRQFANLAATVPGVGLGFHSDVTKLSQYAPQIGGGNGRNVNYLVDGADNNDDTVGGLLQLFPLEAIQEFNVITQRADAEFGRNGAAVLNVVTKSGTNELRGSWFALLRDDALNARTFSERINDIPKQAYQRYQFGGSLGGPIARDRAHFFAAYERTHQDTRQVVNTLGLFPSEDGVYDVAFRENLFTAKLTAAPNADHYLSLRYGRDTNSQPTGAGLRAARSSWATSFNTYDSINLNHNWVINPAWLNEIVVQYATFLNDIPRTGSGPSLRFPGGVTGGSSLAAPQSTEQTKWQFRNDLSWTLTGGGGLGHQLRAGVNWIHEPRLRVTFQQGTGGIFTFGSLDLEGPVTQILVIGDENTALDFPLDSYSLYVQDDWMVNSRLTLNLGLRWDYTSGIPIDQSANPSFVALQEAGRAGRLAGTALADFGQEPKGDTDNIQPRLGVVYDLTGDARTILRGGWGIYTDFAYTNANILTAGIDAAGGGGPVFLAFNPAGIRKPDGSLFRVTDPLSTIASLNLVNPNARFAGEVVSPRLEQPFTYQTNIGWAQELTANTALTVDYVRVDGRDLNLRLRPNALVNGRPLLADIPIVPNTPNFRVAISEGESRYDGLIIGVRRRMSNGFDLNASYTLSRATSDVGTAYDEIVQNLVQDATRPFADVQDGPSTRTDARHRVSLSAIVDAPFGIRVAPIFMYHSALPTHSFEGLDLNADGQVNDRTALAYRFTGLDDSGVATFEEAGACETVNCSRRAPFSQLNLRVSRSFALPGTARIEAIAEVFNLFNAKNPFIPLTTRRLSASGQALGSFMQPEAYAGDIAQPEQRVGQVGFRLTF